MKASKSLLHDRLHEAFKNRFGTTQPAEIIPQWPDHIFSVPSVFTLQGLLYSGYPNIFIEEGQHTELFRSLPQVLSTSDYPVTPQTLYGKNYAARIYGADTSSAAVETRQSHQKTPHIHRLNASPPITLNTYNERRRTQPTADRPALRPVAPPSIAEPPVDAQAELANSGVLINVNNQPKLIVKILASSFGQNLFDLPTAPVELKKPSAPDGRGKKPRSFTVAEIDVIKRRIVNGESRTTVAHELHTSVANFNNHGIDAESLSAMREVMIREGSHVPRHPPKAEKPPREPRFSAEHLTKLFTRAVDGETLRSIIKSEGTSFSYLKKKGLTTAAVRAERTRRYPEQATKRPIEKLPPEKVASLILAGAQGKTLKQLAIDENLSLAILRQNEITLAVIKEERKKLGLKVRRAHTTNSRTPSEEILAEMRRRAAAGEVTIDELVIEYGLSRKTIYKYGVRELKSAKKIRTKKERAPRGRVFSKEEISDILLRAAKGEGLQILAKEFKASMAQFRNNDINRVTMLKVRATLPAREQPAAAKATRATFAAAKKGVPSRAKKPPKNAVAKRTAAHPLVQGYLPPSSRRLSDFPFARTYMPALLTGFEMQRPQITMEHQVADRLRYKGLQQATDIVRDFMNGKTEVFCAPDDDQVQPLADDMARIARVEPEVAFRNVPRGAMIPADSPGLKFDSAPDRADGAAIAKNLARTFRVFGKIMEARNMIHTDQIIGTLPEMLRGNPLVLERQMAELVSSKTAYNENGDPKPVVKIIATGFGGLSKIAELFPPDKAANAAQDQRDRQRGFAGVIQSITFGVEMRRAFDSESFANALTAHFRNHEMPRERNRVPFYVKLFSGMDVPYNKGLISSDAIFLMRHFNLPSAELERTCPDVGAEFLYTDAVRKNLPNLESALFNNDVFTLTALQKKLGGTQLPVEHGTELVKILRSASPYLLERATHLHACLEDALEKPITLLVNPVRVVKPKRPAQVRAKSDASQEAAAE